MWSRHPSLCTTILNLWETKTIRQELLPLPTLPVNGWKTCRRKVRSTQIFELFLGMAILDSNPYDNTGNNWFTNQNNFFRQVRNFIIDTTRTPVASTTTGIHWQVAQATSLVNIQFVMSTQAGTGTNSHLPYFVNFYYLNFTIIVKVIKEFGWKMEVADL